MILAMTSLFTLVQCCSENIFLKKDLCDDVACEEDSWCHSGKCSQDNLCVPKDNMRDIAAAVFVAVVILLVGMIIVCRR